jgi:signal transduction histidine kinase
MREYHLSLFFITLFTLFSFQQGGAQSTTAKKILLINSYHPNYKWTAEITKTVLEEFESTIAHENIQIEFLDARRSLDDSLYDNYIRKYMYEKYEGKKFDLIILFDDYAMNFLYEHGDILFPGVPIIYGGINSFSKSLLKSKKNITGVYEGLAVKENLELIYQLQPSVKKIIILSDVTVYGKAMEKTALSDAALWKPAKEVKIELYRVGDFDSLSQRLKKSSVDTAYLMLAIHQDRNGKYFSFQKEFVEVTNESKSPVYGMWGSLLVGYGCMGGYMTNATYHTHEVCAVAKQVLDGADIKAIKTPDKTRFFPVFDDRLLLKYGVDKSLLPHDSEIQFSIADGWNKYRPYFITLLLFLLVTMLLASYLFYLNRKKTILNNELKKLSMQMTLTNHDIEQLVYSLSHSVRLYACHIQGFVNIYLLEKNNNTAERSDEVINGINGAANNLLKAIDDVVVLGTRQRETGEVPKQIQFKNFVNSIQNNAEQNFPDIDFSIVYSEKEKVSFSYWESELLAVMKELITNAIRFKDPQGSVKIEVMAEQLTNGQINIKIKDNGRGMNLPLYGHRVFKLFERFHMDVSEKGTGLYLVKSILKWRSGDIKIAESEIKKGTVISITLNPTR